MDIDAPTRRRRYRQLRKLFAQAHACEARSLRVPTRFAVARRVADSFPDLLGSGSTGGLFA